MAARFAPHPEAEEQEREAYLQMRKHYRSTRKGRKNKGPHFKSRRYSRPFMRRLKGRGKGKGKGKRRPRVWRSAGKSSSPFGKGSGEWFRRPFGKSKGKGKGKYRKRKFTFPAHLQKGKGKGKGKDHDNWHQKDNAMPFSGKGSGFGKGGYGKAPPHGFS